MYFNIIIFKRNENNGNYIKKILISSTKINNGIYVGSSHAIPLVTWSIQNFPPDLGAMIDFSIKR